MDPRQLNLPDEFSSERLYMRPYRPEDAEMYFRAIRENREHLLDFLTEEMEAMRSAADAEAIIRWENDGWQQRNLFIFGIWEKAAGSYAGEVYLANADWHVPSIEVGYFLLKDCTGKGYATEAAQAALRYAFENMPVVRVDLQCRVDNQASQRVAERCGFKPEGRQRLRHRKKNGELVDRLWYGLLREEWEAG